MIRRVAAVLWCAVVLFGCGGIPTGNLRVAEVAEPSEGKGRAVSITGEVVCAVKTGTKRSRKQAPNPAFGHTDRGLGRCYVQFPTDVLDRGATITRANFSVHAHGRAAKGGKSVALVVAPTEWDGASLDWVTQPPTNVAIGVQALAAPAPAAVSVDASKWVRAAHNEGRAITLALVLADEAVSEQVVLRSSKTTGPANTARLRVEYTLP